MNSETAVDPGLFRAVLGRFASGVTVVTTRADDGRHFGMTVSAFSSVSLQPPLVLVCIDNTAAMSPLVDTVPHFAVNVLTDKQEALSRRFSDELVDRFAGVGYTEGPSGCALLDDVLAWLECRVVARHPEGDHIVLIGAVERAAAFDGHPLLHYRGGYAQLER